MHPMWSRRSPRSAASEAIAPALIPARGKRISQDSRSNSPAAMRTAPPMPHETKFAYIAEMHKPATRRPERFGHCARHGERPRACRRTSVAHAVERSA
jgi:hypothetical protein